MTPLTERERLILSVSLEDLPGGPRPYAAVADCAGLSEEDVLEGIRGLLKRGAVRRVAAVLNDGRLGYEANAMVVWRVDTDELERAGASAAERPEISHVYARKTTAEWPYSLYTMIHARKREEVLAIVEGLSGSFRSSEHRVLFTLHEFTKRPPSYAVLLGDNERSRQTEEAQ